MEQGPHWNTWAVGWHQSEEETLVFEVEGETDQGHSRKRGHFRQMHGGAWPRQKTVISWTLVFQGRMMRAEWREQIVIV